MATPLKKYVEVVCKNCGAVLFRRHPDFLGFSVRCNKCQAWTKFPAIKKKRKRVKKNDSN